MSLQDEKRYLKGRYGLEGSVTSILRRWFDEDTKLEIELKKDTLTVTIICAVDSKKERQCMNEVFGKITSCHSCVEFKPSKSGKRKYRFWQTIEESQAYSMESCIEFYILLAETYCKKRGR